MENSNQRLAGLLVGILDVRARARLMVKGRHRHSHGTDQCY